MTPDTQMQTTGRTHRWVVDPTTTTATFRVRELGLHHVTGSVPVTSVDLTVDDRGAVTQVAATLDPTKVDTRNSRRDNDLRGPRFFDTAHHPQWSFTGELALVGAQAWRLDGRLSVRDVAPVTLEVRAVPTDDPDRTRLVATGSVDRARAGIAVPAAIIGRRVEIELTVTLVRSPR